MSTKPIYFRILEEINDSPEDRYTIDEIAEALQLLDESGEPLELELQDDQGLKQIVGYGYFLQEVAA